MNESIKIAESGKSIKVESPYHPSFVAFAKKRGAKWSKPCWLFDARDRADVEAKLREVYGTAGEAIPLCDVRWALDSEYYGDSWYALGREIASRRGRDFAARIGEGVVVLEGGFPTSGGSVKNPDVAPTKGTVLEIRDVPLSLARVFAEKESGASIIRVEAAEGDGGAGDARAAALERVRAIVAEHGFTAEELSAFVKTG